jgi:DNA polymerase III subunit delta
MDSLDFLEQAGRGKPQAVYVIPGDEDFLKRQVIAALRKWLLGEGDTEFAFSALPGDRASWSAVRSELETLPFLSERRLIVIDQADPFVTQHRAELEKYLAAPARTGVLALEVKTWPANTRLAKLVNSDATIICKTPPANRLPEWCARWCEAQYGSTIAAPAAQLLVEFIGQEMGLLDQELAKLSTYVGVGKKIDSAAVDRLVGNSREQEVWGIFDAIAAGNSGAALAILDRLFEQANNPHALLGAFSYTLRQLAKASRLSALGRPLGAALTEAGVPPFKQRIAEQQMRYLGRRRLGRLFDDLLEIDMGFKGSSQLTERTQLERLVVRLAQKNT